MPKTLNAFAFRDFDGKRILQRPYFRQFGFSDASDAEILTALTATDSDELAELEEKNQRLNDVFRLLDKLRIKSINHSNKRLETYRRALAEKIAAAQMAGAETLSLQNRYNREQGLALEYVLSVPQTIADLMIAVEKIWQDSEQRLQAAYRRRFGERLRQARERAGLSRKELGDAINISPAGYAYYERGQRDVTPTSLIRIARLLKVSADWLIGLE